MQKDSGIYKLQWKDLLKGFILAVLTSVVTIITTTIEAGSLTFDWPLIGKTALLAAIAYVVKNFLTSNTGDFMGKDKPTQ